MSDNDNNLIKEINECYQEATQTFSSYKTEAGECHKFYLSKQWDDADYNEAKKKKVPALNLNLIKKNVDVLVGLQKQNRSDIVVHPVEGSDQITCDVLSSTIKWVMSSQNAEYAISDAYKDEVIGGLGWLSCYIDYRKDPLHGDIIIRKKNAFNITPDPHLTQRDLSDAGYIFEHALVSKKQLKVMYPDYAKAIEDAKGTALTSNSEYKHNEIRLDRNKHLQVKEFWFRDIEKRQFIINTLDPSDVVEWTLDDTRLKLLLAENPHFKVIKKDAEVMKLRILVGDNMLVYNDKSPYGSTLYPFIPLWGFFDSSHDRWEEKLEGIVKVLKDPQREKNKRRSNIMLAINSMPHALWIGDKGAVDDNSKLTRAGAGAKYIEKNPGRTLTKVDPPGMPSGLFQLEQMFSNDIQQFGVNPEMLGQLNSSADTGKTIQLRLQQGLATVSELPDNLSFAVKMLGDKIIELIREKFTVEKIQRICGTDVIVPPDFEERIKNAKYDCEVDEVSYSPTRRMQIYSQLTEQRQYGIPVPYESIVEYMSVPAKEKDKLLADYQKQQQQAMQMQAAQAMAQIPQGAIQ